MSAVEAAEAVAAGVAVTAPTTTSARMHFEPKRNFMCRNILG